MINRLCCFSGSGRLHYPGNTALPLYSARFPHVTLMFASACGNLFQRILQKCKGTAVLKLEETNPLKYLGCCAAFAKKV